MKTATKKTEIMTARKIKIAVTDINGVLLDMTTVEIPGDCTMIGVKAIRDEQDYLRSDVTLDLGK
jgi:hypothetical protein